MAGIGRCQVRQPAVGPPDDDSPALRRHRNGCGATMGERLRNPTLPPRDILLNSTWSSASPAAHDRCREPGSMTLPPRARCLRHWYEVNSCRMEPSSAASPTAIAPSGPAATPSPGSVITRASAEASSSG